jgi:hypothetical protein
MVPTDFANYFLATAGAGGALIGLLFVDVSINPERTFGSQAHPVRQGVAGSAFSALANAFFISTGALMPHVNVGYITLLMGAAGLLTSARLGGVLARHQLAGSLDRGNRARWLGAARVLAMVGVSLGLYTYEVVLGVTLLREPGGVGALYSLTGVVLGVYGVGMVRAWELLGAPRSLIVWLNPLGDVWEAGERADARDAQSGRGGEPPAGAAGELTVPAVEAPPRDTGLGS